MSEIYISQNAITTWVRSLLRPCTP